MALYPQSSPPSKRPALLFWALFKLPFVFLTENEKGKNFLEQTDSFLLLVCEVTKQYETIQGKMCLLQSFQEVSFIQ